MKTIAWAAALLVLSFAGGAQAQSCAIAQNRLQAGSVCLAVSLVAKPDGLDKPLAIVVHGDGGGNVNDTYLQTMLATAERIKAAVPGAGVVFVQRPGYGSRLGRSEGVAKAADDDYTRENVAHMAAAVAALKDEFKPSRVVWAGHSGGAALGALVMGLHPGLVDAAVLSGCPCGSIREWRTNRNYSRGRPNDSLWPGSLSPIDNQDGLRPGQTVVLLTGDRDDNTLARLAAPWVEKARAKGVQAELVVLPGINHPGAAAAPEFASAAARLLR